MQAPATAPPLPQLSSYNNERNDGNRRSTSQPSHHQEIQMNRQAPNQLNTFHYDDQTDESHYYNNQSRSTQQQQQEKTLDPSNNRHSRPKLPMLVLNKTKRNFIMNNIVFRKSPIRTTINSNNNRVLSVSGKLHCSRCDEELGKGKGKKRILTFC